VVIGKMARHVSKEGALDYVFGYSIGNDISQREWQRNDRTMFRGKNCDTFKPFGPWMGTEGADGDMVPGDVIEVEISDIGVLRNYVVAEE
jgi:2-keto-4-pentenoate hydratase/2-oxohepta-3-ene-1,7-dioic acid hydratase in catechol pathway